MKIYLKNYLRSSNVINIIFYSSESDPYGLMASVMTLKNSCSLYLFTLIIKKLWGHFTEGPNDMG